MDARVVEKYLQFRTNTFKCDNPDCTYRCANCLMSLTELAQNAHDIALLSSLSHPVYSRDEIVRINPAVSKYESIRSESMMNALRAVILDPYTLVSIVQIDDRYKIVFKSDGSYQNLPFYASVPQIFTDAAYPCSGQLTVSFPIDRVGGQWLLGVEYQDAGDAEVLPFDSAFVNMSGIASERLEYNAFSDMWFTPVGYREAKFSARGTLADLGIGESHHITGLISIIALRMSLEMAIRGASHIEEFFVDERKAQFVGIFDETDRCMVDYEYRMTDVFGFGSPLTEKTVKALETIIEDCYRSGLSGQSTSWDVYFDFVKAELKRQSEW